MTWKEDVGLCFLLHIVLHVVQWWISNKSDYKLFVNFLEPG